MSIHSLLAVVFAFFLQRSSAATITVPFSGINGACATAKPGDVISVIAGTVNSPGSVGIKGCKGTQDAPIAIRVASQYGVTITGSASIDISGDWVSFDGFVFKNGRGAASYIVNLSSGTGVRFTNNWIDGFGVSSAECDWVFVKKACISCRVDHNRFWNMNQSGQQLEVQAAKGMNTLIDHNHFKNRLVGSTGNGFETIRMGISGDQWISPGHIIEHNLFEDCNGEIETISLKASGVQVRHNTGYRNKGFFTGRHGNQHNFTANYIIGAGVSGVGGYRCTGEDVQVVNNYISGTSTGAVKIYLGSHDGYTSKEQYGYIWARNLFAVHNTLVDNKVGFEAGSGCSGCSQKPTGVVVSNNLVAAASGHYNGSPLPQSKCEGNIAFSAVGGGKMAACAASGFKSDDPKHAKWTGVGYEIYKLTKDSTAAIGAGAAGYGKVVVDIDQQIRSATPDIGADSFQLGQTIRFPPLTETDVGPYTPTRSSGGNTIDPAAPTTKPVGPTTVAPTEAPEAPCGKDASGNYLVPCRIDARFPSDNSDTTPTNTGDFALVPANTKGLDTCKAPPGTVGIAQNAITVCNIAKGEWLEYKILPQAGKAGTYALQWHFALPPTANNQPQTAAGSVSVDGVKVADLLFQCTGAANIFTEMNTIFKLDAKAQTVRFTFDSDVNPTFDHWHFNYITQDTTDAPPQTDPPPNVAINGNVGGTDAKKIPNTSPDADEWKSTNFAAYSYNAYFDSTAGNTGMTFVHNTDNEDMASDGVTTTFITDFTTGEWLEYTLIVEEARTYEFTIDYVADFYEPAQVAITIDGKPAYGKELVDSIFYLSGDPLYASKPRSAKTAAERKSPTSSTSKYNDLDYQTFQMPLTLPVGTSKLRVTVVASSPQFDVYELDIHYYPTVDEENVFMDPAKWAPPPKPKGDSFTSDSIHDPPRSSWKATIDAAYEVWAQPTFQALLFVGLFIVGMTITGAFANRYAAAAVTKASVRSARV